MAKNNNYLKINYIISRRILLTRYDKSHFLKLEIFLLNQNHLNSSMASFNEVNLGKTTIRKN